MSNERGRTLVNFSQSKEERLGKYWLAKAEGASASLAGRMRDWRLSKIERFFGLDQTYNPHTHSYERALPKPVLLPDGSRRYPETATA